MYKIGITGSIGTGKTTIANMFAIFNIPIFNADKEIKKILEKEKIKRKLKEKWPSIIEQNNINKSRLKTIIFSNFNEKVKLEKLLYPYLKIEKTNFEKKFSEKKILIYDVPLIYETKSESEYDLILLANCDAKLQQERVMNRDKMPICLYKKIIKSQLSFHKKKRYKPLIISTNNSKLTIFLKITYLLFKIITKLVVRNEK